MPGVIENRGLNMPGSIAYALINVSYCAVKPVAEHGLEQRPQALAICAMCTIHEIIASYQIRNRTHVAR